MPKRKPVSLALCEGNDPPDDAVSRERAALLAIRNDPTNPFSCYRDLKGSMYFIDQDGDWLFLDLEAAQRERDWVVGQLSCWDTQQTHYRQLAKACESATKLEEPFDEICKHSTGL
jgi:hypothetical protein